MARGLRFLSWLASSQGGVAVWVRGGGRSTEVFWGKAEEYEDDFYSPMGVLYEGQGLEDYVQSFVDEMPPQVQEQIRTNTIPFGLWDKLRARFYFVPKVLADLTWDQYGSSYVNGESHTVDWSAIDEEKGEAKAVPILYSFKYRKPDGQSSRPVVVRFDYDELLQVFQQLGADKSLVYIEMNPTPPEGQSHVRVYNDKESVWLKKYRIKF